MKANVAERLIRLMKTEPPDRVFRVHIFLRSELSPEQFAAAIAEIQELNANSRFDVLNHSKAMMATLSLRDIGRVADLPAVFWISLDSEASLESLQDRTD